MRIIYSRNLGCFRCSFVLLTGSFISVTCGLSVKGDWNLPVRIAFLWFWRNLSKQVQVRLWEEFQLIVVELVLLNVIGFFLLLMISSSSILALIDLIFLAISSIKCSRFQVDPYCWNQPAYPATLFQQPPPSP